jgi:post-segregation antitoxin (ccd killing protein)
MIDVLPLWCYSYITTPGGNIMTTQAKRATVYLDPDLHKALRLKAVETSRSISELVNNAIREALAEDAEDIAAFEERAGEPLISYDEMVKRLKRDGRI